MVPVHPVLAALLKDWRDYGWQQFVGRAPEDGDPIVPRRDGSFREDHHALRQFRQDLKALGLSARPQAAKRRTFVSLALQAGVSSDLVRYILADRDYTTPQGVVTPKWENCCAAVMQVQFP
jgi:hypothetical protein